MNSRNGAAKSNETRWNVHGIQSHDAYVLTLRMSGHIGGYKFLLRFCFKVVLPGMAHSVSKSTYI